MGGGPARPGAALHDPALACYRLVLRHTGEIRGRALRRGVSGAYAVVALHDTALARCQLWQIVDGTACAIRETSAIRPYLITRRGYWHAAPVLADLRCRLRLLRAAHLRAAAAAIAHGSGILRRGSGSRSNARRLLYRRRGIFGFSQQREVPAAMPQAAQGIHERSGYERRGVEVLTRQRAATKDVDPA